MHYGILNLNRHRLPFLEASWLGAIGQIKLLKLKTWPDWQKFSSGDQNCFLQVSTLSAAQSGDLEGAEGFTTEEDQELVHRIEKQLKKRFAIGSQISQHTILQDFAKQKYPERQVQKVLAMMIRRGELQHRMQRKMLYRLKWSTTSLTILTTNHEPVLTIKRCWKFIQKLNFNPVNVFFFNYLATI